MTGTPVGVQDQAAGTGIAELLALDVSADLPASLLASKVQPVDPLPVGEPFMWKCAPPTFVGAAQSETQALTPVATIKVPAGNLLIVEGGSMFVSTAEEQVMKVARRYPLYHHNQAAVPAAVAAPAVATAAQDVGMDADSLTRSYKITFRDAVGRENIASAASASLATTAANRRIAVTLPALPAGAVGYNIYRTTGGNAAAGPWYYANEDIALSHSDVRLDADLETSRTAPAAATWDALAHKVVAPEQGELVLEVFSALTAAPGAVVYQNINGRRDYVAITPAPALTLGTRYRIKLRGETRAGLPIPTQTGNMPVDQRFSDFGARAVEGFNNTPAAIAGQLIVWGEMELGSTEMATTAVPMAASYHRMRVERPAVFPPGSELAIIAGGTAGQVTAIKEFRIWGRVHPIPTS